MNNYNETKCGVVVVVVVVVGLYFIEETF